jgi:hypothetical protein
MRRPHQGMRMRGGWNAGWAKAQARAGRTSASCCASPPMAYPRPCRGATPIDGVVGLWCCCRSSVVEHSLGKGEVVCSIHTGSTRTTRPASPVSTRTRAPIGDHGSCRRAAGLGLVQMRHGAAPTQTRPCAKRASLARRPSLWCRANPVRRSLRPVWRPCRCRSQSLAALAAPARCVRGQHATDHP